MYLHCFLITECRAEVGLDLHVSKKYLNTSSTSLAPHLDVMVP
jgi:hypothetical protein